MGSWNVSCFVSGISIRGTEPVYYIPLMLNQKPDDALEYAAKQGIMRPTNFYHPATFPVLGEYDTYGRLENIVRDANVEHLEKVFKCSIEEVLTMFDGGVFILKEIYDVLVNNYVGEYGPHKDKQYEYKERYEWTKRYSYNVKTIIKRSLRMLKVCKQQLQSDKATPESIEFCKEERKRTIAEIRNVKDSFDVTFKYDRMVLFEEMPNIKKLYFNKIVNGMLYQPFFELNMLYVALHSVCKMYFPTVNGPQCGNYYMAKKLATATNKILTKRLKEMKEDD